MTEIKNKSLIYRLVILSLVIRIYLEFGIW